MNSELSLADKKRLLQKVNDYDELMINLTDKYERINYRNAQLLYDCWCQMESLLKSLLR